MWATGVAAYVTPWKPRRGSAAGSSLTKCHFMNVSLFFFFFIPSFPSPSALIFLQTPEISCYPRQIIVHWNTCLLSNLFALPLINLNSVLRPSPKAGWFWDLEELLVHLQSPFPAYPKLPGISKSSRREQWNPWRLLLLSHTFFFGVFFFP